MNQNVNNFVNQDFNTFNNFNNGNTNVVNLPPIVCRRVNVVHRYQIINQPHIIEDVTQVCNHVIKRHQTYNRPLCCEQTDYTEENCNSCGQMNNFDNNQF